MTQAGCLSSLVRPRHDYIGVAGTFRRLGKEDTFNLAPNRIAVEPMDRLAFILLALCITSSLAFTAERPLRFWNLTRHTISEFRLAPAGTTNWGPDQCKNDKDGTVDSDERLRIAETPPGSYDAKLTDVSVVGSLVRNLKLEAGEIFSIEENQLTSCTP